MTAKMISMNQSRVKMFRRCQKQYSFRYDYPKLYGGKPGDEMITKRRKLPLARGSWMHSLQEALHHQWAGDKRFIVEVGEGRNRLICDVKNWQELHRLLTGQFEEMFEEEREELGNLPDECERLFKSYLRFWNDDQERYEIATLPDGKPGIEFIVDMPLTKYGIKGIQFKGRIDVLVRDYEYGGLWLYDAKWVKTIPPPDERMMSPQALLYFLAVGKHMGEPLRGFVYNYGRTKAPVVPQVLQKPAGMLSQRRNMDTDLSTYFAAIKGAHGANYKKYIPYYRETIERLKGREQLWFRRERIPVESARVVRGLREYLTTVRDISKRELRQEYIPRSYFYNCKFGCEYHSLCAAEFQGLDISPLIVNDYQFERERYGKAIDLLKD